MLKYISLATFCDFSYFLMMPPTLVCLVQPLSSLPLALAPQSEAHPDSVVEAGEEDCPQGHHHQGQGQHVGLPPAEVDRVQPPVLLYYCTVLYTDT